ncbi:hypothetical protein VHUM_02064 [Vanrija humicola]|uniref:Tyrosine specific protein phosphatases domain-containing protein n=1 Tax=Vanrija humicola TaxID=5417 RepID=A0A7D8Z362_VANHU|nr:hypothetical protein VHUM_02064 [Vanrija humicola]
MTVSKDEVSRLARTSILGDLPAAELKSILSAAPFVPESHLLNARDIGLVPESAVRPGLVYRSAQVSTAPAAVDWLSKHVTAIVDLRAERERSNNPDPVVPGVREIWEPTETIRHALDPSDFVDGDGSSAWGGRYVDMLTEFRPTLKVVLEHVRDRPGEGILVHCTAGRDRTGVTIGLLHHLAGTPPAAVLYDYMLTRLGIEPGREVMQGALRAAEAMAEAAKRPGFLNMAELRPTFWEFLENGVRERFGSWEEYVRLPYADGGLGFSEEDVGVIKKNLRPPQAGL